MGKKAAALLLALLLFGGGAVWAGSGQEGDPLSPGGAFFDTYLSIKEAQFELAGSPAEQALIKNQLADQLVDAILEEDNADLLEELVVTLGETEATMLVLLEQFICEECGGAGCEECTPAVCEECGGAGCEECAPAVCEECGGAGCEECTPAVCEECGGAGCEECTPAVCEECGGAGCEECAVCEDCGGEGCEKCIGETIGKGFEQRGWRLWEKVNDETLKDHVRANAQKALDNMARAMEKQAWKNALKAEWDESSEGPPPWANGKANGDGEYVADDDSVVESMGPASGNGNNGNGKGNSNGNSNGKSNGNSNGKGSAPGQLKKQ